MTPKRSWTSKRGDSNFDHHLSILSKCIWKLGKDLQIWNRTSKPPHPSNDNHNRVAQGHDEAETCWQDRKLQIIWVVRTHSRIPIYLMLKQRSSSKKNSGCGCTEKWRLIFDLQKITDLWKLQLFLRKKTLINWSNLTRCPDFADPPWESNPLTPVMSCPKSSDINKIHNQATSFLFAFDGCLN